MNFLDFTKKDKAELFSLLQSRPEGLKTEEITLLRKTFGLNEIKTRKVSFVYLLLRQFKSAFFTLLFFAGVISLFLGQTIEGILIFLFAFINIILGFLQEYRAQKATEALKQYFKKQAKVIRNNQEQIIDSRFLVPGDLVILEAGDIVPSDLRLLESYNLTVDESILTGESQPVNKIAEPLSKVTSLFEAQNIVFSGTAVLSGKAKGIVLRIGEQTEVGQMAQLSTNLVRPSVYEKELADFSRLIFQTVILTIFFIFLLNLILHRQPHFISFLIFCLSLIVGLVPEALPVVVSTSLSQGALKLAKRKVIVKRLSSIEDLGNMEILCTDKTGTLTENQLQIQQLEASDVSTLFWYFLLVSPLALKEKSTNPLDQKVLEKLSPSTFSQLLNQVKILSQSPFDFNLLYSSALVQNNQGEKITIVRGVAESVLKLCTETQLKESLDETLKKIKLLEGEKGERVIVVAFRKEKSNHQTNFNLDQLTLLGYLSFSDPLKKSAPATLQLAKKLNVKIKILTGDSPEVAGKIALEVGLIKKKDEVLLGSQLDNLEGEALLQKCEQFAVFARVRPETKLKIIQTLQKKYEVGFLGEGVNDALALKIAHVGIAVKEATDVSKEAADILLLDSDLKVIIEGIKEGRLLFANINKYVRCALSSNFGNFYSLAIMSLLLPFLPMLPPQILLENIFSDIPLISIAKDTVALEDLRKPQLYKLSQTFPYILTLALVSSLFDFLFLALFYKQPQSLLQTAWFTFSLITEILLILSVRTRRFFIQAPPPHPFLLVSSFGMIFFTLILPLFSFSSRFFNFRPLPLASLFLIFALSTLYLFINELAKMIYFRYDKKDETIKNKHLAFLKT